MGDVVLTVDTENPRSHLCKDWFFFGTTEFWHVETFFFHGKHQIHFKGLTDMAKADIKMSGIRVYMFCDGYIDTFVSVFNTLKCFIGGLGKNRVLPIIGSHVPDYMVNANIEFLSNVMNWKIEKRDV